MARKGLASLWVRGGKWGGGPGWSLLPFFPVTHVGNTYRDSWGWNTDSKGKPLVDFHFNCQLPASGHDFTHPVWLWFLS